MNLSSTVILRADGKNFQQYLTVTPSVLQSLPHAYQVVTRTLLPGGNAEQQRNYDVGNQNGRLYFATSVEPSLYTAEFYHDAAIVTADEQWSRLKSRFQNTTGLFQEQAISAWLAFSFDMSSTIAKNIDTYKHLVFTLTESNAGIPSKAITSRLLTSLPSDFDSFKQAWSARAEEDKQYEALIELIRAEAARKAIEAGVTDVTTLVTRFQRMRGASNRMRGNQQQGMVQQSSRQQSTRRTVITCWSCGGRGHRADQCFSSSRTTQSSNSQQQNQQTAQARPPRRDRRGRPRPHANFSEVFMSECEVSESPSAASSGRMVVDSGSTHHCLASIDYFDECKTMSDSREVRLGNSSTLKTHGCGPATLIVRQGNKLV